MEERFRPRESSRVDVDVDVGRRERQNLVGGPCFARSVSFHTIPAYPRAQAIDSGAAFPVAVRHHGIARKMDIIGSTMRFEGLSIAVGLQVSGACPCGVNKGQAG